MTNKPVKKTAGRPRKTAGRPKNPTKKVRAIKTPLETVIFELRKLHRKGEIQSLTVNPHIINANYEYTYIAFKIPKKEV